MLANKKVAGVTGLEPAASGVTGRRSNRLSYTPAKGWPRAKRIAISSTYRGPQRFSSASFAHQGKLSTKAHAKNSRFQIIAVPPSARRSLAATGIRGVQTHRQNRSPGGGVRVPQCSSCFRTTS